MDLRRALLLIVIVLGIAAIANAFSPTGERADETASKPAPPAERVTPTVRPRPPAQRRAVVSFSPQAKPPTERLAAGRAATLEVEVPQPGQVSIEGLGLTAAADPVTPARFEVLERRTGRHDLRFSPAGRGEARTVGTLEIVR